MSGCSFPTVITGDLRDLGLHLLSNDEDLILSQAFEEIEMNYCFGEIKLEDYFMDFDADKENLMNFDMSFDAENCRVSGMDVDVVTKIEHFQIPEEPRFGCEVDEEEIQALIESQENRNTNKNTRWSYNIFESWRRERNAQCQGLELLIPEIETMVQLNFYLGRFIMRVRRKDGTEYSAKTLYYISCGSLRYLRDGEIYDKNFLDAADPRFAGFRKIMYSEGCIKQRSWREKKRS